MINWHQHSRMAETKLQAGPGLVQDRSYKVGDYTFNPALPGLMLGSHVIRLRPKVAAVFQYLLEHRRHVSSSELGRVMWGEQTDQPPNAIHQLIAGLRRALQDVAGVEVRCDPRQGYRLITPQATSAVSSVPASRALPLTQLLTFPPPFVAGSLQHAELIFSVPQPLEVDPDFARCTMRCIEEGAKLSLFLPFHQARSIPKVLHNFIFSDSGGEGSWASERQDMVPRQLDLLQRSLRISFMPATTPVHLQIYQAGDLRHALALVVPPGRDECVIYAEGKDAYDLAASIRMGADISCRAGMLTNSQALSMSQRSELAAGLNEYFEQSDVAVNLAKLCGLDPKVLAEPNV